MVNLALRFMRMAFPILLLQDFVAAQTTSSAGQTSASVDSFEGYYIIGTTSTS